MLGDRLFGDMSLPEHAYALGVAALGGRLQRRSLSLSLPGNGEPLLGLLARQAQKGGSEFTVEVKEGQTRVTIELGEVSRSVLGAVVGPLSNLAFPSTRADLTLAFCRGLFDAGATIASPDRTELRVRLTRPGESILEGLLHFTGVAPSKIGKSFVRWTGVGALDLLGILYDTKGRADGDPLSRYSASLGLSELARPKMLSRYRAWCERIAHIARADDAPGQLSVRRLREDAVLPSKGRISDSGYDLTIVHVVKSFGNITLFGTGLSIEPPHGWYFDVIARSSLIKLGYMMANSVGVIDRAYRGEIMVPMVKIDPAAADISLPARVAQLIPRPIVHFEVKERSELGGTHRGHGGFGSTGPA